jgi:hypothetical protein
MAADEDSMEDELACEDVAAEGWADADSELEETSDTLLMAAADVDVGRLEAAAEEIILDGMLMSDDDVPEAAALFNVDGELPELA